MKILFILAVLISLPAHAIRYGTKANNKLVAHIKVGDATCTGVRIHRDFIATAVHCFSRRSVRRYKISYWDGNVKINARKYTSNVIFKGENYGEELALIPLKSKNDRFKAPMIYRGELDPAEPLKIYGYGMTYDGVIDNLHSGSVFFHHHYYYRGFPMVVVRPGERNQSPCPGDSGGPLFKEIDGEYQLVGVVSFIRNSEGRLSPRSNDERLKLKACQIGDRAYYVKLSEHQDFLDQHLN